MIKYIIKYLHSIWMSLILCACNYTTPPLTSFPVPMSYM